VAAAEPMQDQALRDHVRDALVAEQSFDDCGIVLSCDGHQEVARTQPGPRMIRVRVQEGVVTLGGAVPSLCHRRLAEVVVWWIPGTRDVHNELSVSPPEADSDDEISDAVRLVLEKEPFLDAAQLGVQTRAGQVTLRGTLTSAEQRLIAERDAWYVPGVCEVIDRIAIVAA
jgi:osmotically-inducible protein OsmY